MKNNNPFTIANHVLIRYTGTCSTVYVPDGVFEVGDAAFAGNTNLQEVVLQEGLHAIGREAFRGCTALKTVILPASLREIRENAFRDCIRLQELRLPEGLTLVGQGTFQGCGELVFPEITDQVLETVHAHDWVIQGTTLLAYHGPGGTVELPFYVHDIGEHAFDGCGGITDLYTEEYLSYVSQTSFDGCPRARLHFSDYSMILARDL